MRDADIIALRNDLTTVVRMVKADSEMVVKQMQLLHSRIVAIEETVLGSRWKLFCAFISPLATTKRINAAQHVVLDDIKKKVIVAMKRHQEEAAKKIEVVPAQDAALLQVH